MISTIQHTWTDVNREFSDFGENLRDAARKIEFLDGFDILLAQGVVRNIALYIALALESMSTTII